MRFNKVVMGSLFVAALGIGTNAAVIEEVKVSEEGAKQFTLAPKITDMDGEKVFSTPAKKYLVYKLKKRITVDPEKKYKVSVKLKQLGEVPTQAYIGFIPYDAKNRAIDPKHGSNNIKESMTTLAGAVAKGAKTVTVKDASKWKKGPHHYVAFNVKEDLSDIPNFKVAGPITKIEKTGDVYTISLANAIGTTYPAEINVRQHRSGSTYIYTKTGKAPKEWKDWKGFTVQGKILRKATSIAPMIMVDARKEDAGIAFTDFIVEEI
jgi:hypothetical protein